ncbi:MAG TPA: alpha/beta hydrolase [Bryobacteraceae bacterium]|nr:alpha/beta hydrolase [Bryobacteraceae bacterium]
MSFIHNFIPGTKTATVLVLHGQGGDENDLLPVARALAPGAAFLSPRGKALENGAARFFERISRDEFDETEVRFRSRELAEWIGEALAKYSLDASKVYAMGFSNGASIAASVMLLHPGTIAGGLLLRPRTIVEPAELPDLKGAPVMVIAGEHDDKMPPGAGEHLARLLGRAGASVELGIADAGHELTPRDFAAGKGWFSRVSGG